MFEKMMVRGLMAVALAAMLGGSAMAGFTPPAGLAPGSEYQIAFVTSGGTTSTSTNIADYNSFVTQQAEQSPALVSLGATWTAIASTAAENVSDNAPTYAAVPIYNTAGQLVATGSSDLWSGSIQNFIDHDQFGDAANGKLVWTGIGYNMADGSPNLPLGDWSEFQNASGECWTDSPNVGISSVLSLGYWWYDYGYFEPEGASWDDLAKIQSQTTCPLYALSSPITVPVPEPGTLTLLVSALLGLAGARHLRRRGAKA